MNDWTNDERILISPLSPLPPPHFSRIYFILFPRRFYFLKKISIFFFFNFILPFCFTITLEKKKSVIKKIETQIEEANEQIKNMEMEAMSVPTMKEKLKARLNNYKLDLQTIGQDFKKAKAAAQNAAAQNRNQLLDGGSNQDELAVSRSSRGGG